MSLKTPGKAQVLFVFLGLFTSCITTQQELDPKVYYKRDICFKLKDSKDSRFEKFLNRFKSRKYRKKKLDDGEVLYCGIGVLPELDTYYIDVIADNSLDRLEMTSCHEDVVLNDGDTVKKGIAEITYIPTIEKGEACPINFGGFSRKKKHSFGATLFEHNSLQLEATIFCNGYETRAKGVGACQSKEQLIQKIVFNEPVYVTDPVNGTAQRDKDCPQLFEDGITESTFLLPNRDCIYTFIGQKSKKILRFHTYGYEEQIVR